jgi:hypothetical protein
MTEEYNNLPPEQGINEGIESQIYELINWEARHTLNEDLRLSEKDLWRIGDWLQGASLIQKFDPEYFDKEFEITDSTREKLFKEANYRFENGYYSQWDPKEHSTKAFRLNPYGVWSFAASLKDLNSERFAQNVKIQEKHGDEVTEWLKRKINHGDVYSFITVYEKVQTIDAQKIAEQVPISENLWDKIRNTMLEDPYLPDLVIAQNIKPEGEEYPDITIPQKVWEKEIKYLKILLESQRARVNNTFGIIKYANILKYKEVKVEN